MLCITRQRPWWILCSKGTIASLLGTEGPAESGTGAGGVGAGTGVGTRASEGARALPLQNPGNVMEGSLGFQQFFLMYSKLMARLRDSKVRELDTTPLAKHKAVMRAGKPNLEELDWAF